MNIFKKILILLFFIILIFNICNCCFASDVVMNLDSTSTNNSISTTNTDANDTSSTDNYEDVQLPSTSVIDDYEDSASLSITNMINIILAVVGVVLILLGIAIIIKIKY